MLTDRDGDTNFTGGFVVRRKHPAQQIEDLKDRRILLGPSWEAEKHAAAILALKAAEVTIPAKIATKPTCADAAVAVVEDEADAAVISSYAYPLLEGCKTIDKGALRIIGSTPPVPFIQVFANKVVTPEQKEEIAAALLAVRGDGGLLRQMESKEGFVRVGSARQAAANGAWTDWRGPARDGCFPLPERLPSRARFLWRRPMTGAGMAGVAATADRVIVVDKDETEKADIFRCLDAGTGDEWWTLEYPAAGDMDFSNAPRANPLIRGELVYLLGAFGDLHCVRLDDGHVVWKRNIVKDFGAKVPAWGTSAAPLIAGDRLIVNPGARDASVVALHRHTGAVLWKASGGPAAYSSFVVGRFGGVEQIIGYDATSLHGWDPDTGRHLWQLVPDETGDFNVPTPVVLNSRLLLTTENNGTRIHDFDSDGRIRPKPSARSMVLAPDCSTPVVSDGIVFGCNRRLVCLDARDLQTRWVREEPIFDDYANLVAGSGRLLITTNPGELVLIRATGARFDERSRLRLFEKADIWSHPAIVGDRLYVRTQAETCCVLLGD